MNALSAKQPNTPKLNLFLSKPHNCNYFPGRTSAALFADPMVPMNDALYAFLMELGFRRSGNHVYRNYCTACHACLAVRVPVGDFVPSRSLRRVWRRNQDLRTHVLPAQVTQEHFNLYQHYINSRHSDGPMSNPEIHDFTEFLTGTWPMTRFVEFRKENQLLMVAVMDILPHALSAIYTFFDPQEVRRSLGTYAILWQVREAGGLDKSHLYLGYWIDNCQKMHYKSRFQPLEAFQEKEWVRITPQGAASNVAPL